MSHNLKRIFIILFLLVLVISPVAAQDNGEPTEDPDGITVTIPGDGDEGNGNIAGIPPYQFVGLVSLVVLILIYAAYENHSSRKLHLEAIDRLFKSTPPFIREPAFGFVSGVGDNILAGLDELARATEWTNLDDEAQAEAARLWQETKDRWQELKQGFTPAQSDPTRDKMTAIRNAQNLLESEGWNTVPPTGYNPDWLDDPNAVG